MSLRSYLAAPAVGACIALAGCGGAEPPAETETSQPETVESDTVSTSDLESSLQSRMADFEALFADGNMGDMIDFLPPKLTAKLLETPGVTVTALKENAQTSWDESSETKPLESYEFDLDTYEVTQASDDSYFKRIPTKIVLGSTEDPNSVSEIVSDTLAIYVAEAWYIVRLNGPGHADYFKEIYPEYADVEIAFPSEEIRERGIE